MLLVVWAGRGLGNRGAQSLAQVIGALPGPGPWLQEAPYCRAREAVFSLAGCVGAVITPGLEVSSEFTKNRVSECEYPCVGAGQFVLCLSQAGL